MRKKQRCSTHGPFIKTPNLALKPVYKCSKIIITQNTYSTCNTIKLEVNNDNISKENFPL